MSNSGIWNNQSISRIQDKVLCLLVWYEVFADLMTPFVYSGPVFEEVRFSRFSRSSLGYPTDSQVTTNGTSGRLHVLI